MEKTESEKGKTYHINLGPFIAIVCMWWFIWVGSTAEVWWRTALISTAIFAGIKLLFDVSKKPKKKAGND
jgi:hypothetical protein